MKIEIEPTPELYEAPINDVNVPTRIWHGKTSGGVEVDVYVLSVVPKDAADRERFKAELPDFMVPSRKLFKVGDNPREGDS